MEEKALQTAKQNFVQACETAKNLSLVQNAASAFEAASVVVGLRNALTPEVVEAVFMPLMNTKIGFLTDRDHSKGYTGEPYSAAVVRDAIIDGASIGLLPICNQMNIIAGRMYPTKEGYTTLLKNMGVKYKIYIGTPKYDQTKDHAQMEFSIRYTIKGGEEEGYKSAVSVGVNKNRNGYVVSSEDQLKGKAERRAKKQLYELISGFDFGEAADADSAPIDLGTAVEVGGGKSQETLAEKAKEQMERMKAQQSQANAAVGAAGAQAEKAEGVGTAATRPSGEAEGTVAANGGYAYGSAADYAKAQHGADELPFG